MKRRWLAFLCVLLMILSLAGDIPFAGKQIKTVAAAQYLTSPEAVSAVFAKQDKTSAHAKGQATAKSRQQDVRKRVIVKSAASIQNTYGAKAVYYYTVGGYQILLYDSVAAADKACAALKKDFPGVSVFQDIPVTMKADEETEEEEPVAYDGIHLMGMDTLKEEAKDWEGSVDVAVIDSGIDTDHPWFDTRLDREESINFAVDDTDPDAYNDTTQGHGTHVAGIITQATPEQVKIMAIRVFDLTGSASYTTITLAVDYAVQHHAAVLNMSLGFEIAPGYESEDTDLMDEAFQRALQAGSTVCVASGNEFTDTSRSYPASSRWTIAVGSVEETNDKKYIRSDFSNNGPLLDFVAPGRNIFSAWIGEGEQTLLASGTSMATPHLAAAAAYVKLKHPSYNQRDVYAEFRDYAVDLGDPGKDDEFGYGYVDLKDYASEDTNTEKKYQSITADAQINKTMNDMDKPFSLNAVVTRGDGALSYTSSDDSVAEIVDNQVVVRGVGSCDIVVTAAETEKYKETSQTVRIRVKKGIQTINIPVMEYRKHLSDKGFQVTASIEAPGDGKLTFLANDNKVLTVSEDGYVTILGTGTAQIYAVARASDRFIRQVSDAITVIVEADPVETQKPQTTSSAAPSPVPSPAAPSVQPASDQPVVSQAPQNSVTAKPADQKLSKVSLKKITAGKKKCTITWKKVAGADGYQIRYAARKNMTGAVVVKTKTPTRTIKKLRSGKTLYVQVRAWKKEGAATVYGAWSAKKNVKIR